ncbi:MAG TPA: hypothetical protein VKE40_25955 [Gemmataceae bacterium]|nr:hypothetical protein [Gemmataceae bacterium]
MRAGPLSDPKVVGLLNSYFVPVYTSNEDYEKDGSASAAEKKERNRIWRAALDAKKSSGTVHVYLLDSKGTYLDSMHVANAADSKKLIPMLEAVVAQLKTPAGKPVLPPAPQSTGPKVAKDEVKLHVVARGFNKGSWREFPGENWVVLDAKDLAAIGTPDQDKPLKLWDVPKATAAKVLTYFYPQTENNNADPKRIESLAMTVCPLTRDGAKAVLRIDGSVTLKHNFYPRREDGQRAEAKFVGYAIWSATGPEELKLVTTEATYGKEGFGVAVRLVK